MKALWNCRLNARVAEARRKLLEDSRKQVLVLKEKVETLEAKNAPPRTDCTFCRNESGLEKSMVMTRAGTRQQVTHGTDKLERAVKGTNEPFFHLYECDHCKRSLVREIPLDANSVRFDRPDGRASKPGKSRWTD